MIVKANDPKKAVSKTETKGINKAANTQKNIVSVANGILTYIRKRIELL